MEEKPRAEDEETIFEMLKVKKTRSRMRTMKGESEVMMRSILNLRVKIQVGLSIRSIRWPAWEASDCDSLKARVLREFVVSSTAWMKSILQRNFSL